MSLKIGLSAEDKVVDLLVKNGYKIIKRNFHSKFGEIDIIVKKDGVLSFVEVKYSQNYNPAYRITPTKMKKIIKTIDYFFMLNNVDEEYQINAALVTPEGIEIVENIGF
ncbi:MAG: YraN family protein [Sulfurospirillum sp.]